MTAPSMPPPCAHNLAERETACADGMCPICMAAELEAHRRSVRAYDEAARAWADENIGGALGQALAPDLATLLSRVDRSATERAAGIADKIAGDPPGTPSGRHDDWQIGHQDGAMECAAAIRAAEPGEK